MVVEVFCFGDTKGSHNQLVHSTTKAGFAQLHLLSLGPGHNWDQDLENLVGPFHNWRNITGSGFEEFYSEPNGRGLGEVSRTRREHTQL